MIAIISAIFLEEVLTPINYIGIIVAMIGAGLISINKLRSWTFDKGVIDMLLSSFIYSLSDVMTRYTSQQIDPISTFAIIMLGLFVSGLAYIFTRKFEFTFEKSAVFALSAGVLSHIGTFFFVLTFSLQFVAVGSAIIESTHPLFVILIGAFLSIFFPHILKEDISGTAVIRKFAALILMAVGIVLLI